MTTLTVDTGRRLLDVFKGAFKKWSADKASRLAAALAYYTVFAIAPLIVVVVAIAGLVFGESAAEGEIFDNVAGVVGEESAVFVQDLVARAGSGGGAVGGAIVGFAITLISASALAAQFRSSLNVVWDVPPEKTKGIVPLVLRRLAGLVTVLGIGLLLIAVMTASTLVAGIEDLSDAAFVEPLFEVLNPLVTVLLGAIAFAILFRLLPAAEVTWRDAFAGGLLTAVLYTIGSWGLSRYLATGAVGSGFGAAAALIVLLVFVYYSAQIVLFGAEFARVYGMAQAGEPIPGGDESVGDGDAVVAPAEAAAAAKPTPVALSAVAAFVLGLVIGRRRD